MTWTKLPYLSLILALAGCVTVSGSRESNTCASSIMEMSGSRDMKGRGQAIVVSFLDENFSPEELALLQALFLDAKFKEAYCKLLRQGDAASAKIVSSRVEEMHCKDVIEKIANCSPQLDSRFDEEIEAEIGYIKEREDNALQEIETILDLQRSENDANSF